MHLVRLQNIVERIRPISVPSYGIDQPLAMYIKMLQTELQQFKDKLPKDLGQNSMQNLVRNHLISTFSFSTQVAADPHQPLRCPHSSVPQRRDLTLRTRLPQIIWSYIIAREHSPQNPHPPSMPRIRETFPRRLLFSPTSSLLHVYYRPLHPSIASLRPSIKAHFV